ncbi:hypothetical protein Phi17218_182 [Cellulophaga phage phi17:2_18]|nr:hypothetical protein Phi17:2_gp182 [Cellulophaga phage phi17:2]AGO47715.1 hypothetical protein Phi17:2_gp182 [Cellulophaga phage phi17:2]ALO80585.1 hypothetical protein Phi17218_182 [Cellulophaga phage phi17:2_18]
MFKKGDTVQSSVDLLFRSKGEVFEVLEVNEKTLQIKYQPNMEVNPKWGEAESFESTLTTFPETGWCRKLSKTLKHEMRKLDWNHGLKIGNNGVAWDLRNKSCWPIQGVSSKKEYSESELMSALGPERKVICGHSHSNDKMTITAPSLLYNPTFPSINLLTGSQAVGRYLREDKDAPLVIKKREKRKAKLIIC